MASTAAQPDPRIRDLYAVPPADFVAARDALARALAAERSPAAAEVKRLRRPPLAAWLLNAVARRRPEVVAEVFAAGDRLRQAQAAGDGEALRASSAALREAVAAGVAAARELAARDGGGAAALGEVERALRAVATTERAARAALEGAVLERPPRAGDADLLGGAAVARPTREAERERRAAERAARAEAARRDRERRRAAAEVERAEQAVRAAEDRARAAARDLEDARRKLDAARDAAGSI